MIIQVNNFKYLYTNIIITIKITIVPIRYDIAIEQLRVYVFSNGEIVSAATCHICDCFALYLL
ncbi:Hypothetical protein Trvi_ORF109 [Trabala vishnou gigantina nucleopolyhedrovirus]|uniref:Hypothetical protein n=1 Tax=Trabala vishnou gigantina nucleopolyhedrovirus TaxID=2863583 RepID=UPI002481F0FB|nr:Hypothetical protein QKU87_gp109 [Trabala vishnou gigantina nucleopolyhedrovirus]QYC92791.1 Hypothetical protein Trvi_ORF109 [Trabala vishnou gigantina nucleopolyhedrovirus]